jgi:hypothetical protein
VEQPVPPTVGAGTGRVRRSRMDWLLLAIGTLAVLAFGWLWLNLDRTRGRCGPAGCPGC